MLKGINSHPAWPNGPDDPTCAWWQPWANAIRTTGFEAVRFDLDWQAANVVQKTSAISSMLTPMVPFAMLGSSGQNWQAPDPEAYAAVAGDVAQALPQGGVLEIWNEPSQGQFWPTNDPAAYARVLERAYATVKQVAPHVIVAAPSCPYLVHDYIAAVLSATGDPIPLDWMSHHPYTNNFSASPDDLDVANNGWGSFVTQISMCKVLLQEHGSGVPVVISEVGWATADPGPSLYRAAINLARDLGVVGFFAFNTGDHPAERDSFSLFNPDYTPTRAAQVIVEA